MLRLQSLALLLLAAGAVALAQSAPAPLLTPGTIIKADVATGFNTADSQVGDQVSVTTTEEVKQGKFKLPKGSTLTGKVLKVSTAPDRSSEASIAILLDSAVTPKGATYPIRAAIASVIRKSPASTSPFSRGGGGGGGYGGYGRRGRGMGGSPTSSPSSTSEAPPQIDVRFPADAATTGSVLASPHGDFWVYPQTHVTLQILANPSPSPAAK